MDCPAARALASEVVLERAFRPIGDEKIERAEELIDSCKRVVCTLSLEETGEWAKKLRELAAYAEKKGKLGRRIMDDWQITLCIDVIGDVWYYGTELQLCAVR